MGQYTDTKSEEARIRDLVDGWMQAMERGDVEKVLGLISDNALFMLPGQKPLTKSDFADGQRAVKPVSFTIDHEIQEIAVSGDLAYCWNHIIVEIDLMEAGESQKRTGDALSLFRRVNGQWLMIRDFNLLTGKDQDL